MSRAHLTIDAGTRAAQALAASPDRSAWVAANAGSGKTFVLARRVVRLLVEKDVDPSRILCLTFTKAAAANMANRVLGELGRFVAMDDDALMDMLREATGRSLLDAAVPTRARRAFARALETPGGLKIQTIHGFCEALLHQFPFEAGIAASFSVLGEEGEDQLKADCWRRTLVAAADDPTSRLGRAATRLALRSNETSAEELIDHVLKRTDAIAALVPDDQAWPRVRRRLERVLGPGGDEDEAALIGRTDGLAVLPRGTWQRIAAHLARGRTSDQGHAARIGMALDTGDFDPVFLTADGKPRQLSTFVTKDCFNADPDLMQAMRDEAERQLDVRTRLTAARTREDTLALLALGRELTGRMAQEKAARGVLDFSDLVSASERLLSGPAGDWVRWKLDRGIEHVLVDEAQDTSAVQWRIIAALVEEVFSGEGASTAARTVFAVGDDKQSIFSFQGAAPELFDSTRRDYEARAAAVGHAFEHRRVRLKTSFRTAPEILTAIDEVFRREPARAGLTALDEPICHTAARRLARGHVELWPPTEGEAREDDPDAWRHPLDAVAASDARVLLAGRIAREVRHLVETEGRSEAGTRRPYRYGDVLILLRRRGALFDAINRALAVAGIPVAGADRLDVNAHIAVMDLMALGRAMLLPEDDLALAAVLKSPLFGLTEEELLALAQPRRGSLIAALGAAAEAPARAAGARFESWRRRALAERPFDFYGWLLGAEGMRKAFRARLGGEVDDALDEFLRRLLGLEADRPATLADALAGLAGITASVRREMDQGRDEVRVMTVHASKGLEAPIVILPDTTAVPTGARDTPLTDVPAEVVGEPDLIVLGPGKDLEPDALRTVRARRAEERMAEYRRLLYVALTRAEDRLIVCGVQPRARQIPDTSWYALVAAAWSPGRTLNDGPTGPRLLVADGSSPGPPEAEAVAAPPPPPAWAVPAPRPPARPRRLAPSGAEEDTGTGDGAAGGDAARRRGQALHALLQHLPDVAPAERAERARRYLAAAVPDLAVAGWVEEALAVLEHGDLAPLFAPGSLAEIPVVGRVTLPGGETVEVAGQIDRLALGPDAIRIVDYKTGAAPDAVPPAYLAQMALYREIIRRIAPDRPVVCALLWTRAPRLDLIDPAALDRAVLRLAGA